MELIDQFYQAKSDLNEYDKDTIIASEIAHTTMKSFCYHGDRNQLSQGMILHYIRKNGTPLDVQAKDISEQYGVEITEEDLIDFILIHPHGRGNFYKFQEMQTIKEAIKKITTFNTTIELVKKIKVQLYPMAQRQINDSSLPF